MKVSFVAAFGVALLAASAVSAQRPDRKVEQPVVRSFNWFAYVAADDIRSACEPGGRNRVRLIYNGVWEEQVRTYEIFLQPDGTAGLDIGVLNDQGRGGELTYLSLGGDGSNITAPWRMRKGQRILSAGETSEIVGLLQASAAFGPPRDGMRLPDNDFWWTVASCRNGVWGFQAYHYPTDAFAKVKFAEKLFALDNVPIAINRPRKLEPSELRRDWNVPGARVGAQQYRCILMVGTDGLRPR